MLSEHGNRMFLHLLYRYVHQDGLFCLTWLVAFLSGITHKVTDGFLAIFEMDKPGLSEFFLV